MFSLATMLYAFGSLVGVASFFSVSGDWLAKNVHPANLSEQVAQDWADARNLRPCVGAKDPACVYPVKGEAKK